MSIEFLIAGARAQRHIGGQARKIGRVLLNGAVRKAGSIDTESPRDQARSAAKLSKEAVTETKTVVLASDAQRVRHALRLHTGALHKSLIRIICAIGNSGP